LDYCDKIVEISRKEGEMIAKAGLLEQQRLLFKGAVRRSLTEDCKI